MSKIRVLMCPAERAPYITNIENSSRNVRRVVGGHIDVAMLSRDPEIVLICNKEGRISGLPLCHSTPSPKMFGSIQERFNIYGDCFICGGNGEEFVDLPEPRSQWLRSAKEMWEHLK